MRLLLFISAFLFLVSCFDSQPKPRSPNELRPSIQAAIAVGDYTKAEKELSEWITQDSKSFDVWLGRAGTRIFLGDAQGAEEDFNAAVKLDPEKGTKGRFQIVDRILWRARDLDIQGQKANALKIYDVLVKLHPKEGMIYHDRGGLKTDLKDYDGAIIDLTKAIEFDKGNNTYGDSFVLRARAKRAKGDVAGAAEDEDRANLKANK